MGGKKVIRPVPKWKILLGIIVALSVFYATMLIFARLVTPDTTPDPDRYSAAEIAAGSEQSAGKK